MLHLEGTRDFNRPASDLAAKLGDVLCGVRQFFEFLQGGSVQIDILKIFALRHGSGPSILSCNLRTAL